MGMELNLEDNNLVYYCKSCHSLHVLTDESLAGEDWDGSYCAKCMSTDIAVGKLDEWLKEEERRKKIAIEIEWNR